MASPAAPGAQRNTVTLSIQTGESANPTATFSAAMAARMVTVGSGPAAHWKVRAQALEPLHAELYWDGNILWVRNGGSLGGTYVSGERADDWKQVFDGTEILLGAARVIAKVAGPDARNPAVANPSSAPASAGYIDEEESTMVFSTAVAMGRIPQGPGPSARPATVAPPMPSQSPAAIGAPMPSQSPAAAAPGGPQRPMRPATVAPPMPSQSPAAMAPPRPSAPPAPVDDIPKPASSEATVIRQSPYAALEAAGMLGPLPAAGNRNPMPGENRTIAPGSVNVSSVVVSPSSVGLPAMAPQVSASLQPVAAMQPMMQPGMQPNMGPMGMPPGMGPMGMQGAPPGASQPGAYDDPFGPIDIPPPPQPKTVAGTSPRTLVLAGITLVVGLIAAVLPPPNQQPAPRNGAAQGGGAARSQAEVLTRGAPAPTTNNILQLPLSEPGLVGVIVPAPIPMTDAQGRPRAAPPPNPQDPMKLAAEAVAANRYADAVLLYDRLAAEHPEAPLFRHFATVLRARVASMHCQPGAPGCIPTNPAAPAMPAAPTPTAPAPTPAPTAPTPTAPTPTAPAANGQPPVPSR